MSAPEQTPQTTQTPQTVPTAPTSSRRRTLFGLTTPKVAGGALASVTAALAASTLGVGGTVSGAAFGSVVSTVGAAMYAHSLDRAGKRVAATRLLVRPVTGDDKGTQQAPPAEGVPAPEAPVAESVPSPEALAAEPLPVAAAPPPEPTPAGEPSRGRTWPKLVGAAVGIFALGMGVITAVEVVLGHPVSGSDSSGTSVSQVVGGQRSAVTSPSPAPETTPSQDQSSVSDSPTEQASADASPSTPASDASPAPADVSPAPADVSPTGDAVPAPAAS